MPGKHQRAGELQHIVELYSLVEEQDSSGDIVRAYVSQGNAYAAYQPFSSRELIAAQGQKSEASVRFVIRFRDDVDTSYAVQFRGKRYQVLGAQPDSWSGVEYLTLTCSTLPVDSQE